MLVLFIKKKQKQSFLGYFLENTLSITSLPPPPTPTQKKEGRNKKQRAKEEITQKVKAGPKKTARFWACKSEVSLACGVKRGRRRQSPDGLGGDDVSCLPSSYAFPVNVCNVG